MRSGSIIIILATILIGALALRGVFVLVAKPVDGDVAVVGLVAKHVAEGKEFPVYMPLQHYAGAVSGYIGAVLFKMFGTAPIVYAFVGVFLSWLWAILTFFLGREASDDFGALSGFAYAAFPPFALLVHSLSTNLIAESLFSLSLVLALLIRWTKDGGSGRPGVSFFLGLASGVALWMAPSAMPALFTVAVVMLIGGKKGLFSVKTLFLIAGFLIGYSPALVYNLQYPNATLFRMAGKMLDLDRSVLSAADPVGIVARKISWKISTIPASFARIPALTSELVGAFNTWAFFISLVAVFVRTLLSVRRKMPLGGRGILLIYTIFVILFYCVLVGVNAPRYLIPLCVVISVFIGYAVSLLAARSRALGIAALAVILLYNVCGTGYSFSDKVHARYEALAAWLGSHDMRFGFSDYYTAYITRFESGEKAIISPTLYHPTFCDRWPADTAQVRAAPQAFYVIDLQMHPDVRGVFEEQAKRLEVTYKADEVQDFVVYRDFSRKVAPEEFAIGVFSDDRK